MFSNYFKTALRHLVKSKTHSFINITGLSVGMAVAMLIGLWIWDELTYNKHFNNHDRIAAVMQHLTVNGAKGTQSALPYVIGEELRKSYGGDFKYVTMASWTGDHILASGDKKITQSGAFFEPQVTDMLSLKMLKGSRNALNDEHAIILSTTAAKVLFGDSDAMNRLIRIDNKFDVKVAGVYEDIAYNSDFNSMTFIASWKLYIDNKDWVEKYSSPWSNNSFRAFVQVADHADMSKVSEKIKDAKLKRASARDVALKPEIFLLPMDKWRLYSEFKNGVNTGGRIEFVWLFGSIGFFVLLLACINFMNLSTARSEKRAKEVGIRKAIGSLKSQLIKQFFWESLLAVALSFAGCLLLVKLILPFFNEVSDKKMDILWNNPLFWLFNIIFCLLTGLIAGSYPAFYLSSFQPVKVLKGTFRVGRYAALPRKILVVLQFTISVVLIIGTIVVFRQVQFAKNRPVGYSREGLITVPVVTEEIHKNFNSVRNELKSSGAIAEMAEGSSATYYVDEYDSGFEWEGKDPSLLGDFAVLFVSHDFGRTIGWHIKEGRDFSKELDIDTSAIILNETAVRFMGLKHPVGQSVKWNGRTYQVVGVIKDMVMESPYDPVSRTIIIRDAGAQPAIEIRINPQASMSAALSKIETVFKKFNPSQPFDYRFADAQYAKKFGDEERMGKLAGFFTLLAVFISCLGLFGMASFMAEKRIKEIGVRKVLGASVLDLWALLSKEFVTLIIISLLIAMPVAYYFMSSWLQRFEYRTDISWWMFAAAATSSLLITLVTVSFQSIKAALANPVSNLRTE